MRITRSGRRRSRSRRRNSRRLGVVEAGGGLVEHEDLGLGHQRAGDFQQLLLAVGQVAGRDFGLVL